MLWLLMLLMYCSTMYKVFAFGLLIFLLARRRLTWLMMFRVSFLS